MLYIIIAIIMCQFCKLTCYAAMVPGTVLLYLFFPISTRTFLYLCTISIMRKRYVVWAIYSVFLLVSQKNLPTNQQRGVKIFFTTCNTFISNIINTTTWCSLLKHILVAIPSYFPSTWIKYLIYALLFKNILVCDMAKPIQNGNL